MTIDGQTSDRSLSKRFSESLKSRETRRVHSVQRGEQPTFDSGQDQDSHIPILTIFSDLKILRLFRKLMNKRAILGKLGESCSERSSEPSSERTHDGKAIAKTTKQLIYGGRCISHIEHLHCRTSAFKLKVSTVCGRMFCFDFSCSCLQCDRSASKCCLSKHTSATSVEKTVKLQFADSYPTHWIHRKLNRNAS